ncbi:hypothetical protein PMAYCL1PPCAC_18939, partial [Pristionchus mayeri]
EALSNIIHEQSLKCAEEGTTSNDNHEVLRNVIAHFSCLLPDGHNHGRHFEGDIKRLATSLGRSFAIHLSSLIPLLIHTLEHAHGCVGGISDQKRFARNLITYITINYGDALAPLSLLLETLVMRQIVSHRGDFTWAAG